MRSERICEAVDLIVPYAIEALRLCHYTIEQRPRLHEGIHKYWIFESRTHAPVETRSRGNFQEIAAQAFGS